MGRWSQREYERQLLGKVRKLFEKSLEDPLLDRPRDTRFTTFIRKLDPEDKTAQACFQSLVQQMLYHVQSHDLPPLDTHSPPPPLRRTSSRAISMMRTGQPSATAGPSRLRMSRPAVSVTSPTMSMPSTRPTSPDPIGLGDVNSPSARRRSASPSFSPSRTRNIDLRVDLDARSPPLSPSRAWLAEYQQTRETTRSFPFMQIMSSMNSERASRVRRRRREDEEDEGRRRIRRRVDHERPSRRSEGERDTRRDGVVFDELPSMASYPNTNGSPLADGLWDFDLPRRRHPVHGDGDLRPADVASSERPLIDFALDGDPASWDMGDDVDLWDVI